MPTRQAVEELRQANLGITALFTGDLTGLWAGLDLTKPEAARDTLLEVVPALTAQYGDIAATVAADWYDQERAAAGVAGTFRASMAPVVSADAVQGAVRYAAGNLFTDQPSGTLDYLDVQGGRYALQPGRDTVTFNAHKDHARFARVPHGAHTCAFCLVMASRGFVYRSAETAGALDTYHGGCSCVAVPDWSDHPAVEGYDPAALQAQYQDAQRTAGAGDLGSILSALRQQEGIS